MQLENLVELWSHVLVLQVASVGRLGGCLVGSTKQKCTKTQLVLKCRILWMASHLVAAGPPPAASEIAMAMPASQGLMLLPGGLGDLHVECFWQCL